LTERAGSVGRETEERPFAERAGSACAQARRAAAMLKRRLAQWRIVVVVAVRASCHVILILLQRVDPIIAASIWG
jgi:hypothetical protein